MRRVLIALGVVVAAALVVLILLAAIPVGFDGLGAHARPAGDYAAATARFAQVQATEGDQVVPDCRSRLLTNGAPTAEVYVLYHGLTNCPRQMAELADALHATGANVLVLRAPGHGERGRAAALGVASAEAFRDDADTSIDIAAGLGDHVTAVGLSLGGLLATWSALERPEVQRAVIIAPAYDLGGFPAIVTYAFPNLFSRLPNIAIPSNGQPLGDHAFPETPTYAVAEMLRLGRYVRAKAAAHPPVGKQVSFVINDADTTISNAAALEVAEEWQRAGVDVRIVRIPASTGLPHDLIDMAQPVKRPDLVYPLIVALAEGREPPG